MAIEFAEAVKVTGGFVSLVLAVIALLTVARRWQKSDMDANAVKHIGPVRVEQGEIKDSVQGLTHTVELALGRMESHGAHLRRHDVQIAALNAAVFKKEPLFEDGEL